MQLTRNTLLVAGASGVVLVLWKYGDVVAPVQIAAGWLTNLVGRGNQLSQGTVVDGVVQETPEVLADMASAVLGFNADRDTLALARVGRSEGVDGMAYRMHVVLNMLAELQAKYGTRIYSSIEALATHSKNERADGHFSGQGLGKPFASAHDPFEGDYALALQVIAEHPTNDPTGGAVKFVDKSGPFYIDGQRVTYDDIVASWASQGLQPQPTLPGASSNFVTFVRA